MCKYGMPVLLGLTIDHIIVVMYGRTYEEGVSWGKFVPKKDGGQFAEVLSDATVVWPLLMMGLLEQIKKKI